MSEAKLTDIHFLVVLVVLQTPFNTLLHISRTTKRQESHLGKLAFQRLFLYL